MKKNSYILKKAGSFGSITGVSRILGYIRDMFFAKIFGTSLFADAFLTAFTFPNLFRKLFGEGALSGSFIPIFSDHYHKDQKSAWKLLCSILTILFIILSALTALVLLGLSFSEKHVESERILYILQLTRIMFPYIILVCTLGFMFGIFNFFGHYALPALSSVILNIALITGIGVSIKLFQDSYSRIIFLSWTVLLCGFIQWIFYTPLIIKLKIPLKFEICMTHPAMSQFFKLYLPSVFAISIMQINVFADRIIAVFIGPGAPTFLYYANRIYQLPLGVFAVSIALASLPEFSKCVSRQNMKGLVDKLIYSLKLSLFISIPSSVGLIVLSKPITAMLFQRGAFSPQATETTAIVLSFYAIGLFAFSNLKTLTYAFYALKDSIIPTKIAFVCMIINILLNIAFMFWIRSAGIALATSISIAINIFALMFYLGRKLQIDLISTFFHTTIKYLIPSLFMGFVVRSCYISCISLLQIHFTGSLLQCFATLISVISGVIVYLGIFFIFSRKDLRRFIS